MPKSPSVARHPFGRGAYIPNTLVGQLPAINSMLYSPEVENPGARTKRGGRRAARGKNPGLRELVELMLLEAGEVLVSCAEANVVVDV